MQYSIIKKSELEGAHRLDAEYYQPEYLNLISKIKSQKSKLYIKIQKLSDLIKEIVSGSYIDTYFDSGTIYLRVNNITVAGFDLSDIKYVDVKFSKIPEKIRVKNGDLVLGRTGTIGLTHLIDERLNGAVMSQHITKIIPNEETIDRYYLIAYLNCELARKQMEREALGSMQVELTLDATKNLFVILPPVKNQRTIGQLIKKFYELSKQSESLYFQAENLLLEELGLKDFEIEDDLSYIVNLSEVKSAHRADAEYFQPKYDKLIEKIKKYGASPLLILVQNVVAQFNSKSQPDKIFQYVELSNITSSVGMIDGFSEVSGSEAPSRAKRVLRSNDVILSSVEGSLEKVALVGREQDGYLASNGFFQFRSKKILPEVLLILAKSIVFQMQLEKQCAGTILTAVSKEAIKNLLIPVLPKTTQQKIADLVQKSHEARKKAKELLEEAKRKVEELISQ